MSSGSTRQTPPAAKSHSHASSPTAAFVALAVLALLGAAVPALVAADWPQWGGQAQRNMVSSEKHLPATFGPGKSAASGPAAKPADTQPTSRPAAGALHNVKWVGKLGTTTYGSPVVSGGKVYIGTNNGGLLDPRRKGDRGVLLCLDEATGKLLWQLTSPKIRGGGNFNGDLGNLGISSTPTVEGDRVYVVTNGCEVLCLTTAGLAGGNVGPFTAEQRYLGTASRQKTGKVPSGKASSQPSTDDSAETTSPTSQPASKPKNTKKPPKAPPASGPATPAGKPGELAKIDWNAPIAADENLPALVPTDADIVWLFDMAAEVDSWVQDAADCSPLVVGDYLYVCTSNGVDSSHKRVASPQAPSIVVLDKKTGRLVAVDDAHVGPGIFHGEWSSPSAGMVDGKMTIFYGGGDGWCYGFDAALQMQPGKTGVLKMQWKFDCSQEYRMRDGKPVRYTDKQGPSEIIGTPVLADGMLYVTIGQDTRHGKGAGMLWCLNPTGAGDISKSAKVWSYDKINRSLSTPSVVGGLVFVADVAGDVHCLDAKTGQVYWVHQTGGTIMASTMVADGKVYVGNDKGVLTVLAAGKEKKLLAEVRLGSAGNSTPTAANGVLYVASQTHLFAATGE